MVTTKISYLHGPRSGINMASQLNTRGGELSFGSNNPADAGFFDQSNLLDFETNTATAEVSPGTTVDIFPSTPEPTRSATGLDLNNNYVKYGAIALLAYFMLK